MSVLGHGHKRDGHGVDGAHEWDGRMSMVLMRGMDASVSVVKWVGKWAGIGDCHAPPWHTRAQIRRSSTISGGPPPRTPIAKEPVSITLTL